MEGQAGTLSHMPKRARFDGAVATGADTFELSDVTPFLTTPRTALMPTYVSRPPLCSHTKNRRSLPARRLVQKNPLHPKTRELSVNLLITFLHMNDEGVVTINGVDGTPGADWCVTIATSDQDGGEYLFTEHQRDQAPPAHADSPDAAPDAEPQGTAADGAGDLPGRRRSGKDGAQARAEDAPKERRSMRQETMLRHEVMSELMSLKMREREDESESSCDEERPPTGGNVDGEGQPRRKGSFSARGEGPGREGRGGERKGARAGADDDAGKIGTPAGGGPAEEEAVAPGRSRHDVGSEATRPALRTPTPPAQKPSPSSSGEEQQNPSAVKRFAKWIVHNAPIGGKKKRGGGGGGSGGGGGGGGAAARGKRGGEAPKAGGEDDDDAGGVFSASEDEGYASPTPPRCRPRSPRVRGFVPVRETTVSMTCPLPSKLPFQPDQTEEEFDAPTFGTTVLGNSHGFDPKG